MRKNSALLFILFLLISQISRLYSQSFYDMKFVTVSGKVSQEKIVPGSTIDLNIEAEIRPEYHINSNKPTEEYLIPTVLKFERLENASFGKIIYPEPEMATFSFSEEELSVYQGEVTFSVKLTLFDKFPVGKSVIKGTLSFQACNDQSCFAPTDENFEISIEVVAAVKAAPVEVKEEVLKPIPQATEEAEPETVLVEVKEDVTKQIPQQTEEAQQVTAPSVKLTTEELKAKQIIEKGLPLAIGIFFILGLGLNLTPCVYPVIPITIGYFGGQSGKSKGSSFIKAL
ncbi:MAG: hypothetical protein JSW07_19790, partial [bacterium]